MVITNHSRCLFAMLSPAVKEKVLELATTRLANSGETVFREGEPSRHLFTVDSGRVALTIGIPSRGVRTLMTLGPGEIFSWSAMVEPYLETCTVRAIEDCLIVQISAEKLIQLCRSDHDVGFEIYRAMAVVLASRVRALQMHLADVFAPA